MSDKVADIKIQSRSHKLLQILRLGLLSAMICVPVCLGVAVLIFGMKWNLKSVIDSLVYIALVPLFVVQAIVQGFYSPESAFSRFEQNEHDENIRAKDISWDDSLVSLVASVVIFSLYLIGRILI